MGVIGTIAGMDILDGEGLTGDLFNFSNLEPLNDYWESKDFNTKVFMLNTGSMLIPILAYMIV
jgi:hypothetical protein